MTLRSATRLCFRFLAACLLSSCCDDCSDNEAEDRIAISFSPEQFQPEDLDSVWLIQYAQPDWQEPVDSIFQHDLWYGMRNVNILPKQLPAGGFGSYLILSPDSTFRYEVTELDVKGKESKGWCNCYNNTRKAFTVNGTRYNQTGQQDPVILSR